MQEKKLSGTCHAIDLSWMTCESSCDFEAPIMVRGRRDVEEWQLLRTRRSASKVVSNVTQRPRSSERQSLMVRLM